MLQNLKALYFDKTAFLIPLTGRYYSWLGEMLDNPDFSVLGDMYSNPEYTAGIRRLFMEFHHLAYRMNHLKRNVELVLEAFRFGMESYQKAL